MNEHRDKKITLSGPGVLPAEGDKQRSNELISKLKAAQSPNERNRVIDEIIKADDEGAMVNGIAEVSNYPNGIGLLVEAIIKKQNKDGKVGGLVWLVENSPQVQKFPKALYLVVRAIIKSGNEKAMDHIVKLDAVTSVPLLVKAIKSRDAAGIEQALIKFISA